MKNKIIILYFLTFLISGNLYAQSSDSTKVTTIVEQFFDWYIKVIKEEKAVEYLPQFVEDENGKTTLDHSKYLNNLEKLSFSEELIEYEKESYKTCIENLKEVEYAKFDSIFDELEDYEVSECDFFNSYRWLGSMESIDGIKIIGIEMKSRKSEVKVQFYNFYPKDSTFYYWNNNTTIFLLKQKGEWKINKIE